MRRTVLWLVGLLATAGACRGQAPARVDEREQFTRTVDSLVPLVEQAAGLRFLQAPRAALRTRDEVRGYLIAKLNDELPPERLEGMTAAYRLLGLLPDTLDLKALLVELYSEQVAGYYDPDSAMLFGVAGFDPFQGRLLVAHELVHALQDQYVPLDSILDLRDMSDRQAAAQAVLEGQAMLVSLRVFSPDPAIVDMPLFWEQAREQVRQQQVGMPVFRDAPLVLRESLLFPYLDGGEFLRWWGRSAWRDSTPYGARMPVSTEQVLHPERYQAGDRPLQVRFVEPAEPLREDTMGELELRILTAHLTNQAAVGDRPPFGWGGDRYRVLRTPDGPALVWVVVWDDAPSAERFGTSTGRWLGERSRPGYRTTVEAIEVTGRPAHRVIIAPVGWDRWAEPPAVTIEAPVP